MTCKDLTMCKLAALPIGELDRDLTTQLILILLNERTLLPKQQRSKHGSNTPHDLQIK